LIGAKRPVSYRRIAMRRVLLVSLFVLGSTVCTQICDMSKMNDGKPFERIEVLVKKDGSINWNGTTVTKERFEVYAKEAAGYREVFASQGTRFKDGCDDARRHRGPMQPNQRTERAYSLAH
jgi:hypothetical protein